jgi:hypothetical protein
MYSARQLLEIKHVWSTMYYPLDASIFLRVWIYSIKPHDKNRKKVQGFCDGSTCGGQTMVHSATYAPTPQQIEFRIQMALAVNLGMYYLAWYSSLQMQS